VTDKITLSNVTTFTNDTTSVNTINNNNALITTALDNTLSRDGTSPNQMGSNLDMNSNQILNLPPPSTVNSPARLVDVVTNPTITLPATGTSGHVVPFLDGNNTTSGNNIHSGTETFNSSVTFNGTTTFAGGLSLANNSVTNSILAQAPANTIKGNNTGSTANETDLTGSQVMNMLQFTAPFTGAVSTSTASVLSKYPTPFMFGSNVGTGSNDQPAIQAAINTGAEVWLPTATYNVATPITLTNQGQVVRGDGRTRTTVQQMAGWSGTSIFSISGGTTVSNPGPQIQDLKITCATPGTTDGVSTSFTYRTKLKGLRISLCANGVNYTSGDNGGATLDDLELWNTTNDLIINGSADTMYLNNIRCWPFDDPTLAFVNHTGFSMSDVEALQATNCMFLCVNQVSLGNVLGFGNLVNCGFDTYNGVLCNAGNWVVSGSYFTGGSAAGFTVGSNVSQSGGVLVLDGCRFSNTFSTIVGKSGGDLILSNNYFAQAGNTNSAILQNASGNLIANGNYFSRSSGVGGSALIRVAAGRATLIGNRCPIDGTGNFIAVTSDDWHRVVYNATGTWTNSFPTPTNGIYSPN
jgi:hypothetical protein